MKHKQIIFILIIVGILLRAYQWQKYPLGIDQVQLLTNAESILSGKLTLIGPRTGPAPLFTGPLIYYWTAFWMIFIPAPYTLVVSTLVLHLITIIVLYRLLTRYIQPNVAALGVLLWSTSSYLIHLDRIPWNPNLAFLAAICVFVPLSSIIKTGKLVKNDILIVCLGVFLGYQAHFSGLFLLPLALLGIGLVPGVSRKYYTLTLGAFILSLVPTLLFDLRHQWMHLKGINTLLETVGGSSIPYYLRAYHDVLISLENGGKYLLYQSSFLIKILIGLVIIIISFTIKSQMKLKLWYLAWLVGIPLLFGLYSGEKPEYYFLIQLPVWLTLICLSILKINIFFRIAVVILFLIFNGYSVLNTYRSPQPLDMQEQIDIAKYTNSLNPVEIIYFMPHATTVGLEYLIQLNDDSTNVVTIEYPKNSTSHYQLETQFIGVKE